MRTALSHSSLSLTFFVPSIFLQDRLKIIKGGIGPDTMLARQVVLNCGAFHG